MSDRDMMSRSGASERKRVNPTVTQRDISGLLDYNETCDIMS